MGFFIQHSGPPWGHFLSRRHSGSLSLALQGGGQKPAAAPQARQRQQQSQLQSSQQQQPSQQQQELQHMASGLGQSELKGLLRDCLKLASENKITAANTWSLPLIENMSELIKVRCSTT